MDVLVGAILQFVSVWALMVLTIIVCFVIGDAIRIFLSDKKDRK